MCAEKMENKFWSIIENDLSIDIPSFIKNGFTYAGFANALSFKEITDTEINAVENLIRDNISTLPNLTNREDFFGKVYAYNPKRFIFQPGDRIFIKQLVLHVKNIVDQNGPMSGLGHFKSKSPIITPDTCTTSISNSYFLNKLLSTANQNAERNKHGFRYDSEIQTFSTYIRMIAGPLAYETLQANLQGSLPSLPSVNRYIRESNYHITEGVLRCEELLNYLNERGLEKIVSLSEDATRIDGRPQYDSRINQIVGFTLPLDNNGMPIPFAFPARNLREITHHFAHENVSNYLIAVMAQPVQQNIPPFCLLLFGSDNKFTACDVKNRWNYIENKLNKVGVKVLTKASDSDPRYNSAMRELSTIGSSTNLKWFSCEITNDFRAIFIQDPIHVVTKLRNLLLRTKWQKKKLPFGNRSIDMIHLYVLLYKFSKGEHFLTESVLNPADRQNFSSAERMCAEKVTTLLDNGIERGEATSLFLKMMRNVMAAYLNKDLTPIERIRCMWYPVFVLRIWRNYIENHKKFNLKDNFITTNCHVCIELNAHSLVLLIAHLTKLNRPDLFLPTLFGSQACESLFRSFRSLSSTYSTVVNCTLKEAASRISKIQLQNEIIHSTSPKFKFPRLKKQSNSTGNHTFDLPSIPDIYSEIENCHREAINTAKQFGLISMRCSKYFECKIKLHKIIEQKRKPKTNKHSKNQENAAHIDFNSIKLKDYTGKLRDIEIDPSSPYVEILNDDDGERTIVKKTSICWLLRKDCRKLSSDRLIRVRHPKRHALIPNQYSKRYIRRMK